jgi:hypothetical protein
MPLWRLLGLANKTALPVLHPLAYLAAAVIGPKYTPLDLDYLRYPCVGDLHKQRTVLKFVPQYTADETLREFAAEQRLRHYVPEESSRAMDEERLRDTLERRARLRARGQARKTANRRAPRPVAAPDGLEPDMTSQSDYQNGNGVNAPEEFSAHG